MTSYMDTVVVLPMLSRTVRLRKGAPKSLTY